MSKIKASKSEIQQVRTALSLAFPECFAPKGAKKRPLKIGIRSDVMAEARALFPSLSRRLIDAFLRDYCGGHNYLKCVVKGASRVDLRGNFAGFVTADEAAHAVEVQKRRREAEAKRKSSRPSSGNQSIGSVASAVVDRAQRLMKLREERERLIEWQKNSEIADSWYCTSGRKAKEDAEIAELNASISALEAAE